DEQRAVDALLPAVLADGLGGGEHVPLVERRLERRAAVARGAEGHTLPRIGGVGNLGGGGGDEGGDVRQDRGGGGLTGRGMCRHHPRGYRCTHVAVSAAIIRSSSAAMTSARIAEPPALISPS